MKVAALLVALGLGLFVPAVASADVEMLEGAQFSSPSFDSASFTLQGGSEPDQLWVVVISLNESVMVGSVTHGAQAFTRQVARAGFGSRTEIWTLSNPDTSFGTISIGVSGPTPVGAAMLRLGGVHPTDPILSTASGAGNLASLNASVTLPTTPRPADAVAGALTGFDDTNMTDLGVTPAETLWGGASDDGPLAVRGTIVDGTTGVLNWTWTSPDPLALNPWTAAVLGIRSNLATPATPTASSVTQTSAALASEVTGDGGGTVSARGFVYCTCPTPTLGDAGVTDVAGGSGTGAFSGSMTGLTRSTAYTVRAYATNGGGTAYSDAITVNTNPNNAPSGTLDGPFQVAEGENLTLGVTASDLDGDTLSYAWDINGDGTFTDATGSAPSLTWGQLEALGLDGPATHSPSVRINDGHGGATTAGPGTLTVNNIAPTAILNAPDSVAEGDAAVVSVSDVVDASAADVAAGIRFAYDFDDDGTYEVGGADYGSAVTSDSVAIPPALLADGPETLTVAAGVIDRDGGMSVFTEQVDVTNVAPTAMLEGDTSVPASGLAHLTVRLADPGDDTVNARLDWGDGTVEMLTGPGALAVSHVYSTPGEKRVTLAATDSDGAESAAVYRTLTVADPPPAPPAPSPTEPGGPTEPSLTCPDLKLDLKPLSFRPRAPFGRSARTLGLRVRIRANNRVTARIRPMIRYRAKGGAVRVVKLKRRTIQIMRARELRFLLPHRARRQMQRPVRGSRVTFVVRARLNHRIADPACSQAPIVRRLKTEVVGISARAGLSRIR